MAPGSLLARVIVNRLWQHHFGRGIVATPNDFGVQGGAAHASRIARLAGRRVDSRRLAAQADPQADHDFAPRTGSHPTRNAEFEPDGPHSALRALNARSIPKTPSSGGRTSARLEAESIRDSMLAVSGTLDRTLYGPGTLDEGHTRRSIYFMVKRSKLVPMMQLFDQPEPLVSVGSRPSTTIAPQALAFLNSPHIRGYAHNFAKRLLPAYEKSPSRRREARLSDSHRPRARRRRTIVVARLPRSQEKSYSASDKSTPANWPWPISARCCLV